MGSALAGNIILGTLGAASLFEGRKSRKSQEDARKIDDRRSKLQMGRQAMDTVKEGQILRSQIIAQGEAQNVSGSSGVLGGAGSVGSTVASNVSFAKQIFDLQESAARMRASAQMHSGNSQAFGTLASLSTQFDFSGMGSGSVGDSSRGASTASFQGAPIGFGKK